LTHDIVCLATDVFLVISADNGNEGQMRIISSQLKASVP